MSGKGGSSSPDRIPANTLEKHESFARLQHGQEWDKSDGQSTFYSLHDHKNTEYTNTVKNSCMICYLNHLDNDNNNQNVTFSFTK